MKNFRLFLFRSIYSLCFLIPSFVSAQNPQDVDMADAFRSEGKIYIAIAGIVIILIGLFIYLYMIGKKVNDLERKVFENQK